MSSCATKRRTNLYTPNPAEAVDPPGLTIDHQNFAYLGGPIRAINNNDFNPGMGAVMSYSGRTLRVPAGENINALVHYYYFTDRYTAYGFSYVSLPPLENGGSYIVFFRGFDNRLVFQKLNSDSGNFESIRGATRVR